MPIFVGATILDLAKESMYNYYYNYIKKLYPGE